ncbi:cytochrome P450 monooxygenase pc-3 [Mycena epipterygia]|nr:cytochrome P450 monooxygenase pc-3 [Mycena epipterygia]
MVLPPGIRFLCRNLPVPAFFVLLIEGFATHSSYGLGLPLWVAFWLAILATVALAVARTVFTGICRAREAKAMGARLVPCAKGTWPGSVDLLRKILATFKSGYLGETFYALVESLGPVVNIRMLWQDKIFTVHPEHIQIILATDFKNYVKGKQFCDGMDSVLGNGVFNSDGEMWSFHRSMTRPYFSRERVRHFEIFNRHTERVIALIKGRMEEGHAVDFQDLIGRFTMDSATEFLFGVCVDSLSCTPPYPHTATLPVLHESPRAEEAKAFTAAFTEAMLRIAFRQRVGWIWPMFEMFSDKTAKPMEVVTKYIDPIIHAALNKKNRATEDIKTEKDAADFGEESSLLDELLKSTSDPKLLKDEILNILLAGRDTTMSVLTNVIYFLACSPAVTARLRDEIIMFVGPSAQPTYENIKQMKYLRAVINETMRLYPPVPLNIRQPVKATTWPSPDPKEKPLYIPAGVGIVYSVMIMQRRIDLWGPDADNFDPDRFLDVRAQKYISNPFQFLPFNAGPRLCLGQQFAYNEMSFVIIRLLQNFSSLALDLDACPPHGRVPPEWRGQPGRKGIEQVVPKAHLTIYTLGGLWVKMQDADNS